MALIDVVAQNASLANDYGPTRGPNAADSHVLELLSGDTEISGNGYVPADVLPADWATPDDGAMSATVIFADPTGEWQAVTGWRLRDPVTEAIWDQQTFAEALEVTGAGDGPAVTITVFYGLSSDD